MLWNGYIKLQQTVSLMVNRWISWHNLGVLSPLPVYHQILRWFFTKTTRLVLKLFVLISLHLSKCWSFWEDSYLLFNKRQCTCLDLHQDLTMTYFRNIYLYKRSVCYNYSHGKTFYVKRLLNHKYMTE